MANTKTYSRRASRIISPPTITSDMEAGPEEENLITISPKKLVEAIATATLSTSTTLPSIEHVDKKRK